MDLNTENFISKLCENAESHKDWITIIEYGKEFLLKNDALFMELLGEEAARVAENSSKTIGEILRGFLSELKIGIIQDD